jgi:acid phosphatase (class A)
MRRSLPLVASLLALTLTLPALAQEAPAPTILSAAVIDPVRLLPPPPPEGSAAQKAELAELHRIQETRTPAQLAQAKWDNDHEDPSAFAPTLGPNFDMAKLPATAKLLKIVDHEQSVAKKMGKAAFGRSRPWIVDATLVGCDHADDKPKSSYPSGHTTMGFAMAVVLADLLPDRAQAILGRAQEYAEDRLVCGVHFRSDIVAGQALGTAVGVQLLHAPALKSDIEAARQELAAAHLSN